MKNRMNINTVLLMLVLGVAGWVLKETVQTGRELAEVKTTLTGFKEMRLVDQQQIVDIKDSLKKLDAKLGETVSRHEFQDRLESFERRLGTMETKFRIPTR
jgi:hypothetical protein